MLVKGVQNVCFCLLNMQDLWRCRYFRFAELKLSVTTDVHQNYPAILSWSQWRGEEIAMKCVLIHFYSNYQIHWIIIPPIIRLNFPVAATVKRLKNYSKMQSFQKLITNDCLNEPQSLYMLGSDSRIYRKTYCTTKGQDRGDK